MNYSGGAAGGGDAVLLFDAAPAGFAAAGVFSGGPEGCVLAVFGVVVVLGHPLLENINRFGVQVAIVRDVNENPSLAPSACTRRNWSSRTAAGG